MRKYKRGPDRVARVLLARTADDRRRCHRSKLITRSLTIARIVPSLRVISSTQRPRNATLLTLRSSDRHVVDDTQFTRLSE